MSKIRVYEESGRFLKKYELIGTFNCESLEYDIEYDTDKENLTVIKVDLPEFVSINEQKKILQIENYFNRKNTFFIIELPAQEECIVLFEKIKTSKNDKSFIIEVDMKNHPNEALIKLHFIKEQFAERINAIESEFRDLKSDVSDLKSDKYDIDSNFRDLKSDVDNLKDRLNNL
jgi:hypothetical protein